MQEPLSVICLLLLWGLLGWIQHTASSELATRQSCVMSSQYCLTNEAVLRFVATVAPLLCGKTVTDRD